MAETWRDMLSKAGPEDWQSYRTALRALKESTKRTFDELQGLGAPVVSRGDVPGMKASPSKGTWHALTSDRRTSPPAWPQVELLVRIAAVELRLPTDDLVREWAAAYQKCGGSPGRFTVLATPEVTPAPAPTPRPWWKRKRIAIPGVAAATIVTVVTALALLLTGADPGRSAKPPATEPSTSPGGVHSSTPSSRPTVSPSVTGTAPRTPPGTPDVVPPRAGRSGSAGGDATESRPTRSSDPGSKEGVQPPPFTPPLGRPQPSTPAPEQVVPGEVAWSKDGEGGAPDSGAVEAYRTPTDAGPEWRTGVYPPGHTIAVHCRVSGRVVPVGSSYTGPPGREGVWYLIKNDPELDSFLPAVYVDTGWGTVPDC
ncbi:hypothetical protein ACF1G0_21865 [Streptomyces sp. NPDC013953]|uniref:hypothetical protein n=1 Tax=Streptomyces sp. NPDC013953 TaxID=3364868 RepID=UPI0036F6CCDE